MLRTLKATLAASAVAASALIVTPAMGISAVPTTISFTSGPTAQVSVFNPLSVSIAASDGATQPTGTVVFRNGAGAIVGQAATVPATVSTATATLMWFPDQVTAYSFTATYTPSNPILAGSTTSIPITIQATPNGQVVQISVPQLYQGIPATLTATVVPATLQGSVAFSVNEAVYGIGPSVPIVNGVASQTFTPTMRGWQQFIVSFTATNSPGTQGAAGQWVNVLPPIGPDQIAISPAITTMKRYQKVTLTTTTASGATPTLSASGGCTLAGTVVTATKPSGTCVVSAVSPGAGGYLPATQTWTVTLTPRR